VTLRLRASSSTRVAPSRAANGRTAARAPTVPRIMKRFTPAVQRIILAFTTGLFLACAAQVSAQPGGLASTFESVAP